MDLMIWRPRSEPHTLSGHGNCGSYDIVVSRQAEPPKSKTPASVECTYRYRTVPEKALLKMNIDVHFKGRDPAENLHPYCIECLAQVAEEMHAFYLGEDSDVYE